MSGFPYSKRRQETARDDRIMKTGKAGEITAEEYLIKKGYQIIERNYRCKQGEIDLIVKKDNILSFVEIKTRNTMKYGLPCESITNGKIRHIKSTAYQYITVTKKMNENTDCRFDVVEVLRINDRQYIRHTENAF